MNVSTDPAAHSAKDIDYHRATAHLYDAVVNEPRRFANDLLFADLDAAIPRGGRMLDLGCGTGQMLERFGARFAECVGVDHSVEMLEVAARKLPAEAHVALVESDLFAYVEAAPKEHFQFVSCVGCLHHLQPTRIRELLEKVVPLLAAGGRLLLAEPVEISEDQLPEAIRRWNAGSVMVDRAEELHAIEVEDADEAPITLPVLDEWPGAYGLRKVDAARGWELFPHHLPPRWSDRLRMRRLHRRHGGSGNIVVVVWAKS